MIDLHCHLLAGIGDGPADPGDSAEMLDDYSRQGISHVTAVCHFEPGVENLMLERLEDLRPAADRTGITLSMAVEYDFVDLERVDKFTAIDREGKYFLLDFATMELPRSAENILRRLRDRGLHAVVVHPEKLFGLQTLKDLLELRYLGLIIMPNAASFLSGSRHREKAWALLRSGCVQAIASDAHGTRKSHRPSRLADCFKLIAKRCGRDYAEVLFEENPARMLNGEIPLRSEKYLQMSLPEKILRRVDRNKL